MLKAFLLLCFAEVAVALIQAVAEVGVAYIQSRPRKSRK